jgi:hypothetical protein
MSANMYIRNETNPSFIEELVNHVEVTWQECSRNWDLHTSADFILPFSGYLTFKQKARDFHFSYDIHYKDDVNTISITSLK